MSLSHLTALSAQTLSQILELQRFSTLPGSPSPPASLLTQITRNMGTLRTGILDMEDDSTARDEVRPMREQWGRMRKMVGEDMGIERYVWFA
jgi:syntaxin 8